MPRKVTKIPEAAHHAPAKEQHIRVAAYCRVSTKHEEQQAKMLRLIGEKVYNFNAFGKYRF